MQNESETSIHFAVHATTGLARVHLECTLSAMCLHLLLISLRFLHHVLLRSKLVYCNLTLGILELDYGADLGLLLHDTLPPDKGREPHLQTDTLMHLNLLGEDAAGCTTDICPECWEPPDLPCGEGIATKQQATKTRHPEP
jgi:hypothetical protein